MALADNPVNTYWAIPGALLAGEYPGDLDAATARRKLDALLDCGVRAFLDLTEPGRLRRYDGTLSEAAQARGIACAYRRMAIDDEGVPDDPSVMHDMLAQIAQWNREGRIVYVHCWGGVGRTGTVVGCALVERGQTGEQALATLRQLWLQMSDDKRQRRPVTPETAAQHDYVRAWRPAAGMPA